MKKFLPLLALPLAFLATPATADGGLSFIIDGDTFSQPFSIMNTSTGGERVIRFGLMLNSGYLFDTVNGGIPNSSDGVAFTPRSGTGVSTGLVGPVTVADGATSFTIQFGDFNVGESFVWDIDIDPVDGNASPTVFGNQLIGATAFVDFSNGLRAFGVLDAVAGNDDASAFNVRSISPIPGVPEPTTWALMILGMGAVGGAMRRRVRTQARVAFA